MRDDEPSSTSRKARPSRGGAHDAGRNLQLVHRRLRYRRPQGCQSAAGRTGHLNQGGKYALGEMRRGLKLVALLVRHDETAINFSQSSGANGVVAEMMKVSKPSSGAWRSATVLMPSAG